jgi:hypothetical protein
VIDKTGLFLDPVIAITAPEKGFWTPNGRHRLAALQRLGAKASLHWWYRSAKSRGRFSPSIPRKRTISRNAPSR